jgi:hypothetical protein
MSLVGPRTDIPRTSVSSLPNADIRRPVIDSASHSLVLRIEECAKIRNARQILQNLQYKNQSKTQARPLGAPFFNRKTLLISGLSHGQDVKRRWIGPPYRHPKGFLHADSQRGLEGRPKTQIRWGLRRDVRPLSEKIGNKRRAKSHQVDFGHWQCPRLEGFFQTQIIPRVGRLKDPRFVGELGKIGLSATR